MNNDTTILLLIAEQHSAILGLRNENTELHQRLHKLEAEKREQEQDAENAKEK